MVVALLLFGLTSIIAPLDLFLSSVGVEPSWFTGFVAATLVTLALLLTRPLRLRLVVCVWDVGLVVTAVWIPLLVFLELQGDPVGILVSWAAALGVGVALTYPPLWRAAETRLWVERGAFGPGRVGPKSRRAVLARLGHLAVVSKCRTVIGFRGDNPDVSRSARLTLTFGVVFVITLPPSFIFVPDPTGIAPLFLTAELAAVFGLPMYFGLSRVNGSES